MRTLLLAFVLALAGCHTVTLGDREVPVEWVDRVPDGLLLLSLELADSEPAELVQRVKLYGTRSVPFTPPEGDSRPYWVGCWEPSTGTIHLGRVRDLRRVWRHELHHARLAEKGDSDPMHQDESWERLGLLAPGDRYEVQP